jgi:hypothetical protein
MFAYLCAFVVYLLYVKVIHFASQYFYVYLMAVTIQQVTY